MTSAEITAKEAEIRALLTEYIPAGDFSRGTVLNDLLVKPLAIEQVEQDTTLATLLENMSLTQLLASDNPDSDMVDRLLSNFGIIRRSGSQATGLVNIYTNSSTNVLIPANHTITCGTVTMRPVKNTIGVSDAGQVRETTTTTYVQMRQLTASSWVFAVSVQTVDNLDTVLAAGLSCTLTPSPSAVTAVQTASTFTGGSAAETDAELLERAQTGTHARVVAGKENIRALLTEGISTVDVLDAAVFGMGDELQTRDQTRSGFLSTGGCVDVYVKTAQVPVLTEVSLAGTRSNGRWWVTVPAATYPGAYGVMNVQYGNNFLTDVTPLLGVSASGATGPLVSTGPDARYSMYQTLQVGIYSTGLPDEDTLTFTMVVMHMPGVAELQALVNGETYRNFAFDMLIRGVIPLIVSPQLEIRYAQGITAPTEAELQQAVAAAINAKPLADEKLQASEIIHACKQAFAGGEVQMPISMTATVWLPDGTFAYESNQNALAAPDDVTGISAGNTGFFCFPGDVRVDLTETSA